MLVDLIHIAYQSLYILLSPLICLLLLSRRDTRKRFLHMWGLSSNKSKRNNQDTQVDWFHAVSYGETVVCLNFIKTGLKKDSLPRPILFTSTIENALNHFQKEIKKLQSNHTNLYYETNLLPLDFKPCLKQFIDAKTIKRFFLVETDFWPELIFYLQSNKVKIFLINGRISHKIASLYANLGVYGKQLFNSFDKLFVQSRVDAERLYQIGIDKELVSVTGNAKYDLIPTDKLKDSENLIAGLDMKIVIIGSLHKDELAILDTVNSSLPTKFQIWIAPRKIEDINFFQRKVKLLKSNYCLYSENKGGMATQRFVLIDEMGVLNKLYQNCDIAIIGGSFNSVGGHNFIEPIMFKKPVIIGPSMRNFEEDVLEFKTQNLINQVKDQKELSTILLEFIENPRKFIEQSVRAHNHISLKMGSSERIWCQVNGQNKTS